MSIAKYGIAKCLGGIAIVLPLIAAGTAEGQEIPAEIQAIRSVGKEGVGNPAATKAWAHIVKGDTSQLTTILQGMDGANPIARNLLRGAFEAIAERTLAAGNNLPVDDLKAFLADQENDPAARRVAFEWIVRLEPAAKNTMLAGMLNDRSLEIRYDAVALALEKAAALNGDKAAAIRAYEIALTAGRNREQVDQAAEALRELGQEVDLPLVFGFITNWHLVAPFDNVDGVGFAAVYPPEQGVDLKESYQGKEQQVEWINYTTDDTHGTVDLNKAIGKHKGAVGYAYHEFVSASEQPAELRLGCINANKIWLNGELLTANEVYHAGARFDQYVGKGTLRKGKNQILIKICQNEQTENWAQDWSFQLRVCDRYGTAILSQDRPAKVSTRIDRQIQRVAGK